MHVSVNGVKLFFDAAGEKYAVEGPRLVERPTVLLLHGGPGFDHTHFKPAFAPLAEVAQLVYLDHRGNGRSEHGDSLLWTLDQWGDDVKVFCDTLGIKKPIVLGYSFGGFVAQAYATRHPSHPGKLILYSTAPVLQHEPVLDAFEAVGGPEVRAVVEAYFAARTPETIAEFRRVCFPLYNTRPDDPDAKLRWIANDAVAVHFFSGEAEWMDFRPALGRISCPTLVVAGRKDPRLPIAFSEMLCAGVNPVLVRLEVFENCGHGPHIEEPGRVMDVLKRFICEK